MTAPRLHEPRSLDLTEQHVVALVDCLSSMRYSGGIGVSIDAALRDPDVLIAWLCALNEHLAIASTRATATEEAHRQLVADVLATRRILGLDEVRCTAERAVKP